MLLQILTFLFFIEREENHNARLERQARIVCKKLENRKMIENILYKRFSVIKCQENKRLV